MMGDTPSSRRIRAKSRAAREGRFLGESSTGETPPPRRHPLPKTPPLRQQRLPPGQKRVENWPVLDLGVQPAIDPKHWRLTIDGALTHPQIWSWRDFLAQPQSDSTSDIHCVTSWSRYANHWRGVSAGHILEKVKPTSSARFVIAHSYDTYTTNLRLEDFRAPGVLLASSWEGKPIERKHGGPLRLVVPHLYFWKSAKWIKRLEFTAADRRGFWEERGYHNRADPWAEERYSWQEVPAADPKKPGK